MRTPRSTHWLGIACVVALASVNLSCTSRVIDAWVSPDADGTRRPDKALNSQFVEFGADTRAVYCVVELSNGREDATIEGVMHQQTVDVAGQAASTVPRDIIVATISQLAPVGEQQRVSIGLTPKDAEGKEDDKAPLSGGVYLCEFALRTKPVPAGSVPKPDASVQFRVAATACPPAQIVTGQECNFFTEGTSCPKDGARSTVPNDFACTCGGGFWSCNE